VIRCRAFIAHDDALMSRCTALIAVDSHCAKSPLISTLGTPHVIVEGFLSYLKARRCLD